MGPGGLSRRSPGEGLRRVAALRLSRFYARRAPRFKRIKVTVGLVPASVATTLSLYAHATNASQDAPLDAIDARYGPRLRVVAGAEMDAKWKPPDDAMVKTASPHGNSECRGRDQNPDKRAGRDRKKRAPSANKRT